MDILQSNKSKNLKQPTCLSDGCELQPHQLDSLTWLAALYSNQINGILADDMVSKPSSSIHISTHLLFRIQGESGYGQNNPVDLYYGISARDK